MNTIYGSCMTNAFLGAIRGYVDATGKLITEEFNFSSQGIGPHWTIDAWGMTNLTITSEVVNGVTVQKAMVRAEVYFTGYDDYKNQPAIMTVMITNPAVAPSVVGENTIGVLIVDYFAPFKTIFTTGSTADSDFQNPATLIQLKDTHGSWFLET